MAKSLSEVAEETPTQRGRPERKCPWSADTEWWFQMRGICIDSGETEWAEQVNKELNTSNRRGYLREALRSVSKELEVRDRWMGRRWMRK